MRWFFKKKKEPTIETPPTPAALSILMMDGTAEEYPENYAITDKKHCVVCGTMYHTHFDCPVFKRDRELSINNPIRAMKIYDAVAQCKEHCYMCQSYERETE